MEYYQIKYKDGTRSYEPVWDEENGLYVIDLNKEKNAGRKRKSEAQTEEDENGRQATETQDGRQEDPF